MNIQVQQLLMQNYKIDRTMSELGGGGEGSEPGVNLTLLDLNKCTQLSIL